MAELTFLRYEEDHPRWDEAWAFLERAYPEFMLHDDVANQRFGRLYSMYPDWQEVAVEDGRAVGWFNSAPISWPLDAQLPDDGWDRAMLDATDRPVDAAVSGTVFGAQIVVDPDQQGRGLSRRLLARMRDVAAAHGAGRLVVPIRPAGKARYPLIPMDQYAAWQDPTGRLLDPWVRVHVSAGGRVIGTCTRAMVIKGSVADWETWTAMRFSGSGRHIVPGALVPVEIDVSADEGVYVEPNLWIQHDIEAPEADPSPPA